MKNLIEFFENQPIIIGIWLPIISLITGFFLLKSLKRMYIRCSYSLNWFVFFFSFAVLGGVIGMNLENFLQVMSGFIIVAILGIIFIATTEGFSNAFEGLSGLYISFLAIFIVTFHITFLAANQYWWYVVIVVASVGIGVLIGHLYERRKQKNKI